MCCVAKTVYDGSEICSIYNIACHGILLYTATITHKHLHYCMALSLILIANIMREISHIRYPPWIPRRYYTTHHKLNIITYRACLSINSGGGFMSYQYVCLFQLKCLHFCWPCCSTLQSQVFQLVIKLQFRWALLFSGCTFILLKCIGLVYSGYFWIERVIWGIVTASNVRCASRCSLNIQAEHIYN